MLGGDGKGAVWFLVRSAFRPRCAKNPMDGGEKEKHGANSETKRRNTSNVTESRHVTRLVRHCHDDSEISTLAPDPRRESRATGSWRLEPELGHRHGSRI